MGHLGSGLTWNQRNVYIPAVGAIAAGILGSYIANKHGYKGLNRAAGVALFSFLGYRVTRGAMEFAPKSETNGLGYDPAIFGA
jgi:hypothetical protein